MLNLTYAFGKNVRFAVEGNAAVIICDFDGSSTSCTEYLDFIHNELEQNVSWVYDDWQNLNDILTDLKTTEDMHDQIQCELLFKSIFDFQIAAERQAEFYFYETVKDILRDNAFTKMFPLLTHNWLMGE